MAVPSTAAGREPATAETGPGDRGHSQGEARLASTGQQGLKPPSLVTGGEVAVVTEN